MFDLVPIDYQFIMNYYNYPSSPPPSPSPSCSHALEDCFGMARGSTSPDDEFSDSSSSSSGGNSNEMPRKRRVSWAEDCHSSSCCSSNSDESNISFIPSPLDQLTTEAEWQSIWYQASDLEDFRSEARDLCRQLRLDCKNSSSKNNAESSSSSSAAAAAPFEEAKVCSLARDHATRGLEQRACLERQRRKYLAIKCIVRAQAKLAGNPDRLALLSHKCTHWAAELAVEEAARDFVRAYHGTDVVDDDDDVDVDNNDEATSTTASPVIVRPGTTKRLTTEDDLSARRVRPRLVRIEV
jgi:hypothetical protein